MNLTGWWCSTRKPNGEEQGSFNALIRLPAGQTLPPFITQLTGITDEQLRDEGVDDRTAAEGEKTLSDLLARRDCCRGQLGIWRNFLSCASATVSRRTVGEIKIRSAVPVKDFQKQVDQGAKELRQLEERIQELNWTTELLEG